MSTGLSPQPPFPVSSEVVNSGKSTSLKQHVSAILGSLKFGSKRSPQQTAVEAIPILIIAGYSLVLMDEDGQVLSAREWDAGGPFEFGPKHSLWINCEFTNKTPHPIGVTEYEVELKTEDGSVLKSFNGSFPDSVVIAPGETKVFPAQWQL